MKILKLRLSDFGSFYGDQTIDIAHNSDKTITFLLGANGSGKTTAIAAISWVLYEQPFRQTELFPSLNCLARQQGKTSAFAEIVVEQSGVLYAVRRSFDEQADPNNTSKRSTLTIHKLLDGNQSLKITDPQRFIDSAFPIAFAALFFWNDNLLYGGRSASSGSSISAALRAVSGVEAAEETSRKARIEVFQWASVHGISDNAEALPVNLKNDNEKLKLLDSELKELRGHQAARASERNYLLSALGDASTDLNDVEKLKARSQYRSERLDAIPSELEDIERRLSIAESCRLDITESIAVQKRQMEVIEEKLRNIDDQVLIGILNNDASAMLSLNERNGALLELKRYVETDVATLWNKLSYRKNQYLFEFDGEGRFLTKDREGKLQTFGTGENVLIALMFLLATINLVQNKHTSEKVVGSECAIAFPILADSLFGPLDNSHRKVAINILLSLDTQIIMAVSPTQIDADTFGTDICDKIGAYYTLTTHIKNSRRAGYPSEDIEVCGRKAVLATYESEFDWTAIRAF
jgi:hypothetical protein